MVCLRISAKIPRYSQLLLRYRLTKSDFLQFYAYPKSAPESRFFNLPWVAARLSGVVDAIYLAEKITNLRVFPDGAGKMSRSLVDTGFALLFISQFTVFGDLRRGRRPGFDDAMAPGDAEPLLERVVALARAKAVRVETGRFRADMRVRVENDGPVTLLIDSRKTF